MAKLSEEVLAKYYDGELSGRKARWVEEYLEKSPEYQGTLKKMNRMGDLLRLMHEESATDVSFDGFADRIVSEITKDEQPGFIERIRVWVAEFIEHRQRIWVPTAAVATAAIAVMFVLPLADGDSMLTPKGVSPSQKQHGGEVVMYTGGPRTVRLSSAIESVAHGKADVEQYKLNYGKKSEVGVVWIRESQ